MTLIWPGSSIVSTVLDGLLLLVEVIVDLLLFFDVNDDFGWHWLVGRVGSPVLDGVLVTGWSIFFVPVEVGLVVVSEVPGVVAHDVWDDLRVCLNSVFVEGFLNAHEL